VAECRIPVISAIGHETDTTLIDHAADLRAPTPTAAAELAVPVKTDLAAYLGEVNARLLRSCAQNLESTGQKLAIAARGLVDPVELVQRRAQTLDYALGGFFRGLDQLLSSRTVRLAGLAGRLSPPEIKIAKAQGRLSQLVQRFDQQLATGLTQRQQELDSLVKLLDANSFERVLDRGFTLVTNNHGVPIKRAAAAPANAAVTIQFADGGRGAVLGTYAGVTSTETFKPSPKKPRKKAFNDDQDRLF